MRKRAKIRRMTRRKSLDPRNRYQIKGAIKYMRSARKRRRR